VATCMARLPLPIYFLVGGWKALGSGPEVTAKSLISASVGNRSHTVQLVASDYNGRPILVTVNSLMLELTYFLSLGRHGGWLVIPAAFLKDEGNLLRL
jgi:hypothetical protein